MISKHGFFVWIVPIYETHLTVFLLTFVLIGSYVCCLLIFLLVFWLYAGLYLKTNYRHNSRPEIIFSLEFFWYFLMTGIRNLDLSPINLYCFLIHWCHWATLRKYSYFSDFLVLYRSMVLKWPVLTISGGKIPISDLIFLKTKKQKSHPQVFSLTLQLNSIFWLIIICNFQLNISFHYLIWKKSNV